MTAVDRLTRALKETFQEASKGATQIWHKVPGHRHGKYAAPIPLAALGTLGAINPSLALEITNQILGAAGAGLAATAPMHKSNEHIRMQMMCGQAIFCAHMALLDAHSAAIVSGVTALRCAYQGMIGDNNVKLKTLGGIFGLAAATGIYASFNEVQPLLSLNNIPLGVMALTTAAEAMPSAKSYISRFLYGGSASMMAAYHGLQSGSVSGFALNALSTALTAKSIIKHDIKPKETSPEQTEENTPQP